MRRGLGREQEQPRIAGVGAEPKPDIGGQVLGGVFRERNVFREVRELLRERTQFRGSRPFRGCPEKMIGGARLPPRHHDRAVVRQRGRGRNGRERVRGDVAKILLRVFLGADDAVGGFAATDACDDGGEGEKEEDSFHGCSSVEEVEAVEGVEEVKKEFSEFAFIP